MQRFLFVAVTSFALVSSVIAQPPNISRWTSGTAITPVQGYSQGSPLQLTWGFMALGAAINNDGSFPDGNNNLQTRLNNIYGSQDVWQPLFQSVFDRWSSISGLDYIYEPNDDGAAATGFNGGILGVRADVRIGGKPLDGNSGVLAYNWFPNRGDMVIDTNDSFYLNTTNNSIRLRNVVAHEHGHGIGMAHVEGHNNLMLPSINLTFDGPQFHDILVAQRGYGDALEKSNNFLGNDTAARATPLGTVVPGSPVSIGNSPKINMANNNTFVSATQTDFISIDSGTDIDFFSFSITSASNVSILLEALGITYNARAQGNTPPFDFNTRTRIDLRLTLFDTNGSTVLQLATNTGFGGDEFINIDLFNAGTYFVRIDGTPNPDTVALDTQFYALTISAAAVPEPATFALMGITLAGSIGIWRYRRRRQLQALEVNIID
ncbi:MAG TPA: matrixin family metalloprotease [Gemmatales bacterium]|nr:matrixin family metalloprotease [Gemmatales bacterium]